MARSFKIYLLVNGTTLVKTTKDKRLNTKEDNLVKNLVTEFVAGATGLEPATNGFGDRYSTN